MANRQKKRNEIDDQYKWDLTTIYKDDEQFLQMLEKVRGGSIMNTLKSKNFIN